MNDHSVACGLAQLGIKPKQRLPIQSQHVGSMHDLVKRDHPTIIRVLVHRLLAQLGQGIGL